MVSEKILTNLKKSSWIRAMFEQGENLRRKFGADNVFDFSLGNPDLEPPRIVRNAEKDGAVGHAGMHGYMSNADTLM